MYRHGSEYIPPGGWTVDPAVRASLLDGARAVRQSLGLERPTSLADQMNGDMRTIITVLAGDEQAAHASLELTDETRAHLRKVAAVMLLQHTAVPALQPYLDAGLYNRAGQLLQAELHDYDLEGHDDEDVECELPGPWQDAVEDARLFQSDPGLPQLYTGE